MSSTVGNAPSVYEYSKSLASSNVITVLAADAETDTRMKEALTNRQYYVYQLTNIMTDARYRMNATVVDDDYFERQDYYERTSEPGW